MATKNRITDKGYCVVELSSDNDFMGKSISSKYTILVLCLQGSVTYEMNLETIKASAGMRITFPHVSLLTPVSMTPDFKALALVMEDNFAIQSTVGVDTEKVSAIFAKPYRMVEDKKEWDMLLTLMDGLNQYQHFPSTSLSLQIGGSIFRNIMLILCDTEGSSYSHSSMTLSAADSYFRNFINMLSDNVRTQHEVSYYADMLNISPKYLGEICKLKSGRKAKEIISTVLISQIKREIIMGNMSMKAIAFNYGFSDQSSLGKFFRKMVGMSPLAFRRLNHYADNGE